MTAKTADYLSRILLTICCVPVSYTHLDVYKRQLDDYHFDMGGLGNVFHICQFAEVMERNHADFYPEIQTQDEQAAWELGGKGYLAIQSYEDGWDYTIYHSDYSVMDGGQLNAPELTIQEAREQILEAHHLETVSYTHLLT